MFYVLHVGGMPFNGDTLKTKSLGGSESAGVYVARELASQGHNVILFTNSQDTGMFDGVKYEWAGNITDDAPLGDRFTYYAENTPHDVCIVQRHPRAFERKFASKMNFWWVHDLALYRSRDMVMGMMWNVDRVLCVSQYHADQVAKVCGIPQTSIAVVNNGVDLSLYACEPLALPANERHIFYSSRPERGLINLVRVGGIMDQLKDTDIHLHVCGYDNTTPQMSELYDMLWQRCEQMPNVTNHGALTKQELAALQKACDAWVYPTEFEEVSCITAMEAMAAGCNMVVSDVAALTETCGDTAACLVANINGVDIDTFEYLLRNLPGDDMCGTANKRAALNFTWAAVAGRIQGAVNSVFPNKSATQFTSLMHHFMRHSDIKAFEAMGAVPDGKPLRTELMTEFGIGYKFYREDTYAEHYATYYEYEKERGVNYGPEDVSGTTRFMSVANMVAALPATSRVLDYGCAHGHYTIALARRFPELHFVGADLAQSNIDKAIKWAADEGLTNVLFQKVSGVDDLITMAHIGFDLIIAAEVIEHVGDPQNYVDSLAYSLAQAGKMVITVPYGPWEAQGYREHKYWRAHLHHFERQDLNEMLGHHPDYKVIAAPAGRSKFHSTLGSYIVSFSKPTEPSREIDYQRKINQTMPDQTVACCMIVKDAAADILRCLNSVLPHVQEFIIGIDETTTDDTMQIVLDVMNKNPLIALKVMTIPSPTETGFAAARNTVIEKADCDWILWIDSDEVLVNGEVMGRYLRNSMYNGFAVKQHHFSNDPIAVIKVDMPCRLFRNGLGIKFFGLVHEHPELKLNEGLGPVSIANINIVHHGYTNEGVRRKRFSRNLPLLARDREECPERLLGKFLWLRDLAQSCQYDMEDGRVVDAVFDSRVAEGVALFAELLEAKNYRLVLDALPYYSQLVVLKGDGVDFSFMVDVAEGKAADATKQQQVQGCFTNIEQGLALMRALTLDKIGDKDRRYL